MAWTGGVNSVRFFEIDLNLDGTNDLLAFEKHGNRILPFLRENEHYTFAPQYRQCFPDLHDWVILKDYNNDGRPDIFTYGLAGIRVFQNISTDSLAFRLVTDQLQAYYYNGYVNIYASPDDYLVVDDIDNDGHLDILNFGVLGKYVHQLRNYSQDPNQFDFHLESECWGHFEEAADNNLVTLFSDCSNKSSHDEPERHTGSSMLLHDMDNNGLPDLLLGDIDSPNIILLHNHGTLAEARMTEQDTAFPINAPVQLYSMPAPSLVNIPGQQQASLIFSPADPSLTKSQDLNSVWRYDFDTLLQQYTLTSTDFLQSEMIDVGSGCYPVFYDWNKDGLLDLFLANYGSFDSAHVENGFVRSYFSSSIQYFQNTGTSNNPIFTLIDPDFAHLKELNHQALYPTFGDLDGDGLTDMLCGQQDGTLLFVPNSRIEHGNMPVIEHFLNIDVGDFSTPTLFDLDKDGYDDLIIGNKRGLLCYHHRTANSGTASFEHVTDTLGGVDVRNADLSYYGYSVPCFYRDEEHGTVLFCGSESGNIFYYNNIDNHLQDGFTLENLIYECADDTSQYGATLIDEGRRSGVAVANLFHNVYPDMLVGNYAGGCALFQGRTPAPHVSDIQAQKEQSILVYPNPTNGVVHLNKNNMPSECESINIYDIFGRLQMRTSGSTIDISHLSNGIYIIEIDRKTRQKIVLQSTSN